MGRRAFYDASPFVSVCFLSDANSLHTTLLHAETHKVSGQHSHTVFRKCKQRLWQFGFRSARIWWKLQRRNKKEIVTLHQTSYRFDYLWQQIYKECLAVHIFIFRFWRTLGNQFTHVFHCGKNLLFFLLTLIKCSSKICRCLCMCVCVLWSW